MPKITNFIVGSCFGYYDQKQKSCTKCKYKVGCENASKSKQVNEIKKIFKVKKSIIQQLNERYK